MQTLGKAAQVCGAIEELCKQQQHLADIDDASDSLQASKDAATVFLHEYHVRIVSWLTSLSCGDVLTYFHVVKVKLASLSWTEHKEQFLRVQAVLADKAAHLQELSASSYQVERAKHETLYQIEQLIKAWVLVRFGGVDCVKSIQ